MRKWNVFVAVVGVLLSLMAGVASAQLRRARAYENEYQGGQYGQPNGQGFQQGQQYQRASQQAGGERYYAQRVSGQAQGASSVDQQLASWLLVDNRGEIQLARLAQERASSDDVKEFAKKVIDDHSKLVEELQQFAGLGRGMPQENSEYETANDGGRLSQTNTRGNQQYRQSYTASGRGNQQPGGLNLVRLKQQLGQQCLASAERELEQKDGAEFDKCYIGMQIAKHMEMLDTLRVFSRYASPQLDELIEQAEPTTQDHLEHAMHLIKQLEKENGSDTSTRSSRSSDSSSSDRSSSDREARRNRSSDDDK